MKYDLSVGFILYRRNKEIDYLLLQRYDDGIWDFPKGHLEKGESFLDAARRELSEETGIDEIFLRDFKYSFSFINPRGANRRIHLFLAETSRDPVLGDEHGDFRWCSYEEAMRLIEFQERREALTMANRVLNDITDMNA